MALSRYTYNEAIHPWACGDATIFQRHPVVSHDFRDADHLDSTWTGSLNRKSKLGIQTAAYHT
jgi:hypothetical protein